MSEVKVVDMLLLPKIYKVIGNRGCNSYVIETDIGLVVVDVGYLGSEAAINKYIDHQINASPEDVAYIIITHARRSSVEALPDLLAYCINAKAVMHEKDMQLVQRITYLSEDMEIIFVSDDYELHDARIKLFSTPGYTPGGISVLYEKAMFIGGLTYISTRGLELPRQVYDKKLLLNSLKKLVNLEFDSMFPAYGRYILRNAKQKLSDFLNKNI